jgi:prevent-host-death family protein
MERFLTVSETRQRFLKLVDETIDGDQVIVTKRGKPAVAMIGFERLQTLKLIAGLWQDPDAMAAMKEAIDQANAGRMLRFKGVPNMRKMLKEPRARKSVRG